MVGNVAMVGNVRPINNIGIGPIRNLGPEKSFLPMEKSNTGRVINVNRGNIRQIVTTQSGETIVIPTMLGSTTTVKPLKDGTYEVTTKASVYGAKAKKMILSEEEFITKFGAYKTKFHALA